MIENWKIKTFVIGPYIHYADIVVVTYPNVSLIY